MFRRCAGNSHNLRREEERFRDTIPLSVLSSHFMPSKKVVFFFPACSSQEATAPLGILAVSTPLIRAGYQVRIIDSTITPDFHKRTLEELDDALCLAISLVTGPMIKETVQIARGSQSTLSG